MSRRRCRGGCRWWNSLACCPGVRDCHRNRKRRPQPRQGHHAVLVGPTKTEVPRYNSAGCRHSRDGGGTGEEGEKSAGKRRLRSQTARHEISLHGAGTDVRVAAKGSRFVFAWRRSTALHVAVDHWDLTDGRRTDGRPVPNAENFLSSRVLRQPLEVRKSPYFHF